MIQSDWEVVQPNRCVLGESPIWDDKHKRILWVDILKGEIHYYYPDRSEHNMFKLDQMVGAIAISASGGIVAALKSEIAMVNLNNETIDVISKVETNLPDNRFNDGKCDPAGRFWAGTMSISNKPNAGSLYSLEKGFSVKTKIIGVSCSNGLAWSLDYKTLYYIDTPTQNVVAYNYDITSGGITRKRIVVSIPIKEGYPDGMTIDTEGMLWVALWGGWKVIRYNPGNGEQLHQINLPVSQVTSCTFGGDKMEDIYITSAKTGLLKKDLIAQPLAGSLFIIKKSGFTGIKPFEFMG